MSASSRFAVAVHILTLLAQNESVALSSECIAGSVNTNPVVIRRVLGLLRRACLVTSQPGLHGGWRLARSASTISLAAVYRATESDAILSLHHRPPNPNCPVGRHIQDALTRIFRGAEAALEQRLAPVTVAHVLGAVLEHSA